MEVLSDGSNGPPRVIIQHYGLVASTALRATARFNLSQQISDALPCLNGHRT
jgi:hypothetical protein